MGDFGPLIRNVSKLERELSGANLDNMAKAAGVKAQADVDKEVRSDVGGDMIFTGGKGRGSGWPKARFETEVKKRGLGVVSVAPARKGIGVFRTANDGRHPGMSGHTQGPALKGFIVKGKRAGQERKVRRGKWNGTTKPMHTWDRAAGVIEDKTVGRVAPDVTKAIADAGLG